MCRDLLPENVRKLPQGELFQFRCHPGVDCFTDCCRQLELALTPYDVLRLRKALKLTSSEFLERHAVIEQEQGDVLPRVYLGMVDDGRASCPFVTSKGCVIYKDRPGACRIYPLGRAAFQNPEGKVGDFYVLITEPHCRGFKEKKEQEIRDWIQDQELESYNEFNDLILSIIQHKKVKQGARFTEDQIQKYMMSLYDLDAFANLIKQPEFKGLDSFPEVNYKDISNSDTALLRFGIRWIKRELFGE